MLRLEQLRKQKGVTKTYMAQLVGKTMQAYAFYESGQREMPTEVIIKYAEYFGVTVGYLLGVEDAPKDDPVPKQASLSIKEKELLSLFRRMDSSKQERLIGMAIGYAGMSEEFIEKDDVLFG